MTRRLAAGSLFIVYCIAFACGANSDPVTSRPAGPTYIIFLDLTLSLSEQQLQSQNAEIKLLAAGIPARARVVVYPLGGYVGKTGVLLRREFPDDEYATGRGQLTALRKSLPQILERTVQNFRRVANDPEFYRHTCISDGIQQAAQVIGSGSPGENTEIVFISDMLEDCSRSLIGKHVSLEKLDIESEMDRAKHLPPGKVLVDLKGAGVSCIVPASGGALTKTPQPQTLIPLRVFWELLFSHCNIRKGSFFLDARVPDRLTAQRP